MGNSNAILQKHLQTTEHHDQFPKLGVKLSFIDEFIEFCDGKSRFEDLTTTDVCENFVKPITNDAKCSFCELLEHSNHPAVGIASIFVSHAWQYKFLEVIEALKYHFRDNMDTVVWFDLFSNNQHKAISLNFEWWSGTFRSAIAQFGHTVMVLAPWNNPIPLTRAWCLFEIYCTIDTGSKFEIALNQEQQKLFFEDMIHFGDMKINEMLATIKVENSKCFHKEDKVRIFAAVEQSVGFGQVNAMIFERLREWVVAITMKALSEAIAKHNEYEEIQLKNTLAVLYNHQGKYEEAERLYEECLQKRRVIQGPNHQETLIAINDLANLYDTRKNYQGAERLYKEYLEKLVVLHDASSSSNSDNSNGNIIGNSSSSGDLKSIVSQMVLCMNNLAVCYENQGKYLEAEQLYESCLEKGESHLSNMHPNVLSAMNNLGVLYCHAGRLLEAKHLLTTTLNSRKLLFGEDHPDTLNTLYNMGTLYMKLGHYDDAQICYEQCFDKRKKLFGESHPDTMDSWISLNKVLAMKEDMNPQDDVEEDDDVVRPRLERCASVRGTIDF